jgi:hypothetical protein
MFSDPRNWNPKPEALNLSQLYTLTARPMVSLMIKTLLRLKYNA